MAEQPCLNMQARAWAVIGTLLMQLSAVAYPADQAPARIRVANLEAFCRPQTLQSLISRLSTTATVKELPPENVVMAAMPGGTRFVAAAGNLPAYCQVSGSFVTNPKTGKTANFLATFPDDWNGKYLQMGCSGHCGQFAVSNAATPVVTVTNQGLPGDILRKGYASFATDEGHVGFSGGAWAIIGPNHVDEDAIEDFYHRATRVLARFGKQLTVAVYGEATKSPQTLARSYFGGCSGGGRDAFVAASYFPEEFDGIVAGSAYNLVGTSLHAAGVAVAQLRADDAVVTEELIGKMNSIVRSRCDKVDGVEDGLVQNPAACDFRPDRDLPRCAGGAPHEQCFTRAQIETLSTLLTAMTDEQGNVVQPGFSVSEVLPFFRMTGRPKDLTAADPWPLATNSADTASGGGLWDLGNSTMKVFIHENDPGFFTRSLFTYAAGGPGPVNAFRAVVPAAEVSKALSMARMGIGHFPENAATLIKQDRKFLIWHNFNDEKLSPYMSINYYKRLAKLHGGYEELQKNVRLFMLPGTAHCSGGGVPVGPGSFDALTAIENWVEKGLAPDALLATLYQPTAYSVDFSKPLGRTMPLCKFPTMARYSGKGDVNDAANWSCPPDDQSLLKIGESGRQAGVVD